MAVKIADTLGTMGEGGYPLVNASDVGMSDKTTLEQTIAAILKKIGDLFNMVDNITYITADTYADAPDPASYSEGLYVLLIKQDENYPKTDDECYSTLYICIADDTPTWEFVGKLNVSEKMMSTMITSAIASALTGYYTKSETYSREEVQKYVEDNAYELPIASDSELGGIKIGENIIVDEDGYLSIPTATNEVPGVVKAGRNITIEADGTINASGGGR